MDLRTNDYQAAIPACCAYQKAEEHANYLGQCWGLLTAIYTGREMDCTGCEMNVRTDKENNTQLGDDNG
jgi:hypothetical protein